MKDFCKWLGVEEKIAKLLIWLFIGMAFLMMTNVMLESVGLPYYKITVDNISKINTNKVIEYLSNWSIILLNFYTMIFLVFRIEKIKEIIPYSILYLILNIIIKNMIGSIGVQIYIIIFVIIFCYLYSNKKREYILYGIGSYITGVFIQYACYLYKLRFIDYSKISEVTKLLTSIDYFIIMLVIILIKEKIEKKREGE